LKEMDMATEAAQQAASDAKNAVSDKKLPVAWRAPMIEMREAARALKHKEMLQLAAAVVEEVPQKQTKTKWDPYPTGLTPEPFAVLL
jgi:NADH:ubiquinone oxidoreductase subunit C